MKKKLFVYVLWVQNSFTFLKAFNISSLSQKIFPSLPSKRENISVSTDPEYPQLFTGRLCFLPSIVKVDQSPGSMVQPLTVFGYSLGGTVALEYDTSPVGYYREYVTMSSLVTKRGSLGQWGSRLYVSTREAEEVCRSIWGVPAEQANINFEDSGDRLKVSQPPNPTDAPGKIQSIFLQGWKNTRILSSEENRLGSKRYGNLGIFWTPTIKALWFWAPFITYIDKIDDKLPIHKLRLSASAIRLHYFGFGNGGQLHHDRHLSERYNTGFRLGVGLIVDNVSIEIGELKEKTLWL